MWHALVVVMVGALGACTRFKTPVDAGGSQGDAATDTRATDGPDQSDWEGDRDGGSADDSATDAPIAGSVVWARSGSTAVLLGVAEGASGVVVTGYIAAPANLGGALLGPAGAVDTVVAEFSTDDGSHLYSNRFGSSSPAGTGSVYGYLDVLDSTGAPVVQGVSYCDPGGSPVCNAIDVGLGAAPPGGGSNGDGFIGRYSVTTGQPTWVARLFGPGEDHLSTATNGPNGTIYVAGWSDRDTTLVSGTSTRTFTGGGYRDVIIAQLSVATG